MSSTTRRPSSGDRLILPDGREFRLSQIGIWSGSERFKAVRHAAGQLERFEGVVIGLVWHDPEHLWRYPSMGTT